MGERPQQRRITNATGVETSNTGGAPESALPAPKDRFVPMMRLYRPKETPPSILDGSWKIPEVKEAP